MNSVRQTTSTALAALMLTMSAVFAAEEPVLNGEMQTAAVTDHAPVIEQAMEQALTKLADGNVREFTVAYLAAVKSYAQFAQQLHDHAHTSGAAAARLKWALSEAGRLDVAGAPAATQIPASMSEVRGQLLADIKSLRDKYQSAGEESRPALAEAIQIQVDWLDSLDQWLGGWAGNQQVDKHLPMDQLRQRVELLRRQLERDQQLQQLAALTLTEVLGQSQADLERALEVMIVNQQLPANTLAELRQTTSQMREILDQVQAARVQAMQAARSELSLGPASVNWAELQPRVNQLLGDTPQSQDSTTSRQCRPRR